jgi:hypothetical protein
LSRYGSRINVDLATRTIDQQALSVEKILAGKNHDAGGLQLPGVSDREGRTDRRPSIESIPEKKEHA